MLDSWRYETLAALTGTEFQATTENGRITLRLTSVRTLGGPALRGGREPFALDFAGPADVRLAQGTHALTHDVLGTEGVFLVPVGATSEGFFYEAIFT